MKRKAFILLPFLVLFSLIVGLISNTTVNEFRVKKELESIHLMDTFSLIEIETLKRIKSQFETFKPIDFTLEAGEWLVSVNFQDESAIILYEGPEIIQATLDYDMVMENVLDYIITDESTSDSD